MTHEQTACDLSVPRGVSLPQRIVDVPVEMCIRRTRRNRKRSEIGVCSRMFIQDDDAAVL
jgi:hypothetical protein